MRLIWNTTKPVEMAGWHKPVEMRVMKGWWPSRFAGYDIAGRSIATRDQKR